MKFENDMCLIVIASCFALGVKKTGPVAWLESLFKVSVNKYFNVLALRSHGECCDSLWGSKVAEDKGAKDWGERAPVANDVTCDRDKFVFTGERLHGGIGSVYAPVSRLKADLCSGQTIVEPSPSLDLKCSNRTQ